MTWRNTTLSAALNFVLVFLVSCSGLSTRNHPPMVFALNLSSVPASLELLKDQDVLVTFPTLSPLESRPLTKVPVSEGAVLRLDRAGESTLWTDPSGTPYSLKLQAGVLYAVIIDPQGAAALYSLPETYSNDPKLCLISNATSTLSQVQAAPDWAKNVKVYAQDVAPVVPSEFYSIEPKPLGLYWQTPDQLAKGEHSTAQGPDGKPLRQAFLEGHYYLFLAGEGSIRDLTPTLD